MAMQGDSEIRQWINDMLSGKGLQSADDIYAGMKPGIDQGAFNFAGSQASQMASRGISRSGYAQKGIADVAQMHGNALAEARKSAGQQATQAKNTAFEQGTNMSFQMDDRDQRQKIAEMLQKQQNDWNAENSSRGGFFDDVSKFFTGNGLNPSKWF
jgi:hypothetical protein